MISCKDAALELTESLDRKISLARRIRLGLHLAICKECQRLKAQLALLQEAARSIDKVPHAQATAIDGDSMSPKFRQQLQQTVENIKHD